MWRNPMIDEDFKKMCEEIDKYGNRNYVERTRRSLEFWKRKHDAGRVPDEYYEKTKKALLDSIERWKKEHNE